MNKRVLSKLPRKTLSIHTPGRRKDYLEYYIHAQLVEDGSVLMLHFYDAKKVKEGQREASFRTFISHEDYINQELNVEGIKWTTSSLWNKGIYYRRYWAYQSKYNKDTSLYICSKEEKEIMSEFLKGYIKEEDEYVPLEALFRYQQGIMDKKLELRHRKETDPIDRLMETVGVVPEDFITWTWEEAMSFSQYLIYEPMGKLAMCTCTKCGHKGAVARKDIYLKNNEKGECPFCHRPVTFKARGRMPYQICDERSTLYVEPREDAFVLRFFSAHRTIGREGLSVRESIGEYRRCFYSYKGGDRRIDAYEYAQYKQTRNVRWCHSVENIFYPSVLYPGNLPEAWAHTPLKYSALELLGKQNLQLNNERAMEIFRRDFPALEWIIKMGLYTLACDIIGNMYGYRDYSGRIYYKGETIYEILKLNKESVRILQAADGNIDELRILQVAEVEGLRFTPEALKDYYEKFGCNTELLRKTKKGASLHKICKYIEKESVGYPHTEDIRQRSWEPYVPKRIVQIQDVAHDWIEYIGWCRSLKYDLDNMFYYLPKNFKEVHDRTYQEYQAYLDKKKKAELRKQAKTIKKRMAEVQITLDKVLEKAKGFSKNDKLLLVVPESATDLKNEGAALHHCVGTYVDRVAKGETLILFIRKKDKPTEPYYTMEWKDDRVIQCRGSHNHNPTPQVQKFVDAFEREMLKAAVN